MRVTSFHRDGLWLKPIGLELSLTPGLPELQILGLPDAALKESIWRIKAAIRAQGFKWPKARRVIVQLEHYEGRVSSQGLDLAIAAALLWETGQVERPQSSDDIKIYGRLTLEGDVELPGDFDDLPFEMVGESILTGPSLKSWPAIVNTICNLQNLERPEILPKAEDPTVFVRPPLPSIRVGASAARLLSVIACGEHPFLLAGPAGGGKSTLARLVHPLLKDPAREIHWESRRIWRRFGLELEWRPFVQPHHSATPIALVGGSAPIIPGEITRAHGGVLFLDEFMQFDTAVREALREPMESGVIHLARSGDVASLPAKFLLIAATNLCKCGRYVPERNHTCTCAEKRRRPLLEALSGPALDRFDGLAYSNVWFEEMRTIEMEQIQNDVDRAIEFAERTRGQLEPNHFVDPEVCRRALKGFEKALFPDGFDSLRRENAVLRVARTMADLARSESIAPVHVSEALKWCSHSFQALKSEF